MDLLRSPLHWLFQSSSVPEAPVQQEMACTDDSDFIDIEEGLLMAEEPSLPSNATSTSLPTIAEKPYQIKIVPGKGLGLIATRNISAGELIISESPLLRMKTSEMGYYRLEWEVNRLKPVERKEAFWKLHHSGMEELPELFEIWTKNSFSAGQGYQSVFKVISRINNSCTPNSSVSWIEGSSDEKQDHNVRDEEQYQGKMNVFAVRDITEGEEITVCYTSVLNSRNARHEVLQEIWEFACRCDACFLKGQELTISEKRRRRAASILHSLGYEDKDSNKIFRLINEGLELLEQERLYGQFFSLSWFAYQYAALHEQWEEAKYWAGQAYEHSKLVNGSEHPSSIICRHGMHNPQYHLTPSSSSWSASVVSQCVVA